MDKELLYVGGGFLIAPIVGIAAAAPFMPMQANPLIPISVGTIAAMSVYILGCVLHERTKGDTGANSKERL